MILTRRPKLTATQQRAYDEMLPLLVAGKREFQLPTYCSHKDVNAAYQALHYDHFELFWLGMTCKVTEYARGPEKWTTVSISEIVRDAKLAQYKTAVAKEIKGFLESVPASASAYDKVCAAYEYVCEKTDYDADAKNSQNLLGVFLDRRSACAGYSEAFALLLEAMGIPAACVTGKANGGNHEWNLVCIDGTYVFVDPTWGDPTFRAKNGEGKTRGLSHAYLCVTDKELSRTHVADNDQLLPACTSNEYDWYARRGCLVKSDYKKRFDALLAQAVAAGERSLELKFATNSGFDEAKRLFASKNLSSTSFGKALGAQVGAGKTISVQMAGNENMRVLSVSW